MSVHLWPLYRAGDLWCLESGVLHLEQLTKLYKNLQAQVQEQERLKIIKIYQTWTNYITTKMIIKGHLKVSMVSATHCTSQGRGSPRWDQPDRPLLKRSMAMTASGNGNKCDTNWNKSVFLSFLIHQFLFFVLQCFAVRRQHRHPLAKKLGSGTKLQRVSKSHIYKIGGHNARLFATKRYKKHQKAIAHLRIGLDCHFPYSLEILRK